MDLSEFRFRCRFLNSVLQDIDDPGLFSALHFELLNAELTFLIVAVDGNGLTPGHATPRDRGASS